MRPESIDLVSLPLHTTLHTLQYLLLTRNPNPQAKLRPILSKEEQMKIREDIFYAGRGLLAQSHHLALGDALQKCQIIYI